MPRLTITMLCLNRQELTQQCVESILANTADCELRILDNGSTDGTPEYLKHLVQTHAHVFAMREERNIGFIRGHNTLATTALGDFICVLNNDVQVGPGWDDALIAPFERDPWIGATGPKDDYGFLAHDLVGTRGDSWKDPEYLSGHCLCVPRWILRRFGLFDDEHLTWATGEDSDFSLRLRQAGYKIRVVPEAPVTHLKRATIDHVGMALLGYDPIENERRNRRVLCQRWRRYADFRDFPMRKILIKRDSANGDVLCTEPVIRAVKQLCPNSGITVQTRCSEMLLGAPMIRRIVTVAPPEKPDQVIDLDLAYERNPKVHMIEAYAQVAGVDLQLFPPTTRRPRWHLNPQGYEAADALPTDRPIAVIATDGSWPIRQWRKARFAEIARWLQRYFRVIEVGLPGAALNVGWNLCGKTTAQQLAAVYSQARLAVMCDSLHVHLAACFKVPTVGIWGGTDPLLRIHGPEHRVVQRTDFPCRGCHHDREAPRCHSVCDRGAFRGMTVPENGCMDISVDAVRRAIEETIELRQPDSL